MTARSSQVCGEPEERGNASCALHDFIFTRFSFSFLFYLIMEYQQHFTLAFAILHHTHTHTQFLSSPLIYITNCARIKLHAMRRIFEFLSVYVCVSCFYRSFILFYSFTVPNTATKATNWPHNSNKMKANKFSLCICMFVC